MRTVSIETIEQYCGNPCDKRFDTVYVMGDIHGRLPDLLEELSYMTRGNDAVILLGDAGLNYFLNGRDANFKKLLNNLNISFYCLRGNHEARPEDILNVIKILDCTMLQIMFIMR